MKKPHGVTPLSVHCPPYFVRNARHFGAIHYHDMDEDDRHRWERHEAAPLAALRVPCCGLFVRARGHEKSRRNLPEGVLIYCTQGKGVVRFGSERETPVEAGDLVWCPPMTAHAYKADEEEPWTIAWMHLTGTGLAAYAGMARLPRNGGVKRLGLQEDLIDRFHALAALHHPGYDDARLLSLQGEALAILGAIGRLTGGRAALTSSAHGLRAAMDLMDETLHLPFDLARYARAAGLSESYFTRTFRRACGKPPIDHFLEEKMHRACLLLSFSDSSIKDIATGLGYHDALYFSRVFKKRRGVSPETYRANQAKLMR